MIASASPPTYLTPPEIASRLRVDVSQVHGWIRAGELTAANLAARVNGRPRWKVSESDLELFLVRRRSQPAAASAPRRRRRRDEHVVQFF